LLNETSASTSLVARVGQIITLIILVGVISMISSMLVTESLSGDAEKINNAGALRMQAIRISRVYLLNSDNKNTLLVQEVKIFEQRLHNLLSGGLLSSASNEDIKSQYQKLIHYWEKLKQDKNLIDMPSEAPKNFDEFDKFVKIIDKLVTLLQIESEKKLSILRLIQGISLLLVLIISIIILNKLNKFLIIPLKQLVKVANETGKGNFELKAQYQGNDELGVLSHAINKMSSELKQTYQDFEQRVEDKTQQLTQSNQSLEILFQAAKQLTQYDSHHNIHIKNKQKEQNISPNIIKKLEQTLGAGRVSIQLNQQSKNNLVIDFITPSKTVDNICFNHKKFPLEKQTLLFGYLIWQFPKAISVQPWQLQILQAMAEIIATAIELDQKRNSDNRLLIIEERAVIARELHDSLAQSLSYLKVQMSLLTRKMQKQASKNPIDESIDETIGDIKQGLNAAYLQLRELLTTFRLKLDDPSLANTLHGTIAEFQEKCQHPIKLHYQLPDNYLSANQEIHLLQIVREALSNIHRHANATHARVDIQVINNQIEMNITDNGTGVPQDFSLQGHFGLGIMEERAKSLNSLIDISNISPHGTKISLTFTR